jgi:hypothetical protein
MTLPRVPASRGGNGGLESESLRAEIEALLDPPFTGRLGLFRGRLRRHDRE